MPLDLQESSFFFEKGHAAQWVEDAKASLDLLELRRLANSCLLMFKADCHLRGLHEPIFNFLLEHGVKLRWWRLVSAPHPLLFEELYKYNLTLSNDRNQFGLWWMNSKVHQLSGIVVALASRDEEHPRGSIQDIHATLNALKGSSTPHLAPSGTIRHAFAGTNRTMNLLHVSDGPISTWRELRIFQTSQSAARDAILADFDIGKTRSCFEVIDCTQSTFRWIDFFSVYTSLVVRVLLEQLPPSEAVDAVVSIAASLKNIQRNSPSPHFASIELRNVVKSLDRFADQNGLLQRLSRPERLSYSDMEQLVRDIQSHSIAVSDIEAAILVSTSYYSEDYISLLNMYKGAALSDRVERAWHPTTKDGGKL